MHIHRERKKEREKDRDLANNMIVNFLVIFVPTSIFMNVFDARDRKDKEQGKHADSRLREERDNVRYVHRKIYERVEH